jgi:ribonuclease HI
MIAYTDGSIEINSGGIGAWSYVLIQGDKFIQSNVGIEKNSTNNRVELMGIIEAAKVESVKLIYSDSQYSINVLSGLWKSKMNLDLIVPGKELIKNKIIELKWIKGHSGHKWNDLADYLAGDEVVRAHKEYGYISAEETNFLKRSSDQFKFIYT